MQPTQAQLPRKSAQKPTCLSDEDQLSLLMAVPLALSVVAAALPAISSRATGWLLAHEFIVAASATPLVTIPGTDGAGLDLRRLIVAVAVLAISAAFVLSGARRSIDRRRQRRLRRGDSA